MLEVYEEVLNEWIEQSIAIGDDDHLFATGYLQGHISVVFSQLEESKQVSLAHFFERMDSAFVESKSELAPDDYVLVRKVWQEIEQHFKVHAQQLEPMCSS